MKIVYAVKVEVFLVPAEHGFPRSNVDVRVRHSGYVHSDQSLIENSAELREIPRDLFVE